MNRERSKDDVARPLLTWAKYAVRKEILKTLLDMTTMSLTREEISNTFCTLVETRRRPTLGLLRTRQFMFYVDANKRRLAYVLPIADMLVKNISVLVQDSYRQHVTISWNNVSKFCDNMCVITCMWYQRVAMFLHKGRFCKREAARWLETTEVGNFVLSRTFTKSILTFGCLRLDYIHTDFPIFHKRQTMSL